ncbi:MAG: VTT domain-containing protein [Bryobacteraceae bacterium]|nr:VTT domain-containing protein [Bryobacteraceae bacterium]
MKGFVDWLVALGPLGVFLLAALDSAGVPLPAAVDLLVVALAAAEPSKAVLLAALAIIGSIIGNMVLFTIARKGGEAYLARYTAAGRGAKFRQWFLRYGLITVFIPASVPMIPLPLKIFVLSAGALRVRPLTFFATVVAARVPRYGFLAWLGAQIGENSVAWLRSHVRELLLFALALFALLYLMVKLAEKFHKRPPGVTD